MQDSFTLYGGEVVLVFDKTKHEYFVDEQLVPNASSITGVINKDLANWHLFMAAQYVRNNLAHGETVTDEKIRSLCDGLKAASRQKRDAAAECGTEVHKWIEGHINGVMGFSESPPMDMLSRQARNGVEAFLSWERLHSVQFLESERKVYSREHRFAGTLDLIAMVDGQLTLVDFKTSKAVYREYWLQTMGYKIAWEEETLETLEQHMILRTDKETGQFDAPSPRSRDLWEADKRGFLACRSLWEWLNNNKEQRKKKN